MCKRHAHASTALQPAAQRVPDILDTLHKRAQPSVLPVTLGIRQTTMHAMQTRVPVPQAPHEPRQDQVATDRFARQTAEKYVLRASEDIISIVVVYDVCKIHAVAVTELVR